MPGPENGNMTVKIPAWWEIPAVGIKTARKNSWIVENFPQGERKNFRYKSLALWHSSYRPGFTFPFCISAGRSSTNLLGSVWVTSIHSKNLFLEINFLNFLAIENLSNAPPFERKRLGKGLIVVSKYRPFKLSLLARVCVSADES